MAEQKTYTVDVTAYEHVATVRVVASSEEEAIRKVCELHQISVTVRSVEEKRDG